MVDVEVGDEDGVEPVKVDAHLSEPDDCAGTDVDEHARYALDEDDIAGARAPDASWPAGAEDGKREGRGRGWYRSAPRGWGGDRRRRGWVGDLGARAPDRNERCSSDEHGAHGEPVYHRRCRGRVTVVAAATARAT